MINVQRNLEASGEAEREEEPRVAAGAEQRGVILGLVTKPVFSGQAVNRLHLASWAQGAPGAFSSHPSWTCREQTSLSSFGKRNQCLETSPHPLQTCSTGEDRRLLHLVTAMAPALLRGDASAADAACPGG